MYNLNNLDFIEFEKLSKDIMRKKLNIEFERFGVGKDYGIDLRSLDKTVICQCKRYNNVSNLINVLKKEVSKVKSLNPKRYYIITSLSLTPQRKDKIYKMFEDYMDNTSNIITKDDIDDFLSTAENKDIVIENTKLWLTSSNVLNTFFSKFVNNVASVTLEEIKKDNEYFVETDSYKRALSIIDSNDILLINGNPGSGKSITSRMIIRYLLASNDNYKIRTVSGDNLTELISSISDSDEEEIIYMDDFLGQTMLEISDDRINNLKILFSLVKKNKNKKLIINSRITILNKAIHEKISFEKLLIELKVDRCLIDMNNISRIDKARILYNLIRINSIAQESYNTVVQNKKYNKIIDHESFSPRIIEMCCKRYKENSGINFYDYILKALNNPNDLWKDEFEKLSDEDCILMYLIYMLGNDYIDKEALIESFNNYCEVNNVTLKPSYSINDSFNRLLNSMIGIHVVDRKKYIKVLNPSINDYIQNDLINNKYKVNLYKKACLYLEEYKKIKSFIKVDTIDGFENLKTYNCCYEISKTTDEKKVDFIVENNYLDSNIKDYVKDLFQTNIKGNYLLKLLLYKDIRDFYDLNIELTNYHLYLPKVDFIDYGDMLHLFRLLHSIEVDIKTLYKKYDSLFIESMTDKSIDDCIEQINDLIKLENVENKFDIDNDFEILDDYICELESELNQYVEESFLGIKKELELLNLDINFDLIDKSNVEYNVDVRRLLEDDKYYLIKNETEESSEDGSIIDLIFQDY